MSEQRTFSLLSDQVHALKEKLNLNYKQSKFIRYYLQTGNGSQSAERAGYAHAGVYANYLLKHSRLAQTIKESLKGEHMELAYILTRLREHIESEDGNLSLKAIEQACKIQGYYAPEKRVSVTADIDMARLSELTEGILKTKERERIERENVGASGENGRLQPLLSQSENNLQTSVDIPTECQYNTLILTNEDKEHVSSDRQTDKASHGQVQDSTESEKS